MSHFIDQDLDGTGHLVEPPIIDFLSHDKDLHVYLVEFIPDEGVSSELKEMVKVGDNTASGRRVAEWLGELGLAYQTTSPIIRVAHAGGGDFDLYTQAEDVHHLRDSPNPQFSFDVYAVLQGLSQEVQLEFIRQRRGDKRRAVG
jgi:hypothetical protein